MEAEPTKPCRTCGTPVEPNAAFCPQCGEHMPGYPASEVQARHKRDMRSLSIALAAFLGCGLIVLTAVVLGALAVCNGLTHNL